MKKIEVLAPVGSKEALEAAVQNGADAVYLAGVSFGARKHAKNFSREELKEAVEYAHIRNVSVYVTVNILVKDKEFRELRDYIDFLYVADVDAVIVQDLGVARYVRENYPDLDLHASTQMSAHSFEDVKFLKEFGFKRVVVAREMSISEISKIRKQIDIEVEVFVHGALCVSYSGQCLMSSMIGGRSGNRGSCAQPCRQKYTIDGQGDASYLLSPRDLCTLDEVERLINMGITSLKIEGRMKRSEYAAVTVKTYKDLVDGFYNKTLKDFDYTSAHGKLKAIFNRSFTKGFVFEDKKIVASDAPGNRGVRIGTVAGYNPKEEKLSIRLEKRLHKGDEIQIRRGTDNIGARTDVFYFEGKRVTKYNVYDIISVDFKHNATIGEVIYRTFDTDLMQEAKQSYLKEFRKSNIEITCELKLGQPIKLTIKDDLDNEVTKISERVVEEAINRPLDDERVRKQLMKLGSTSYEATEINIILDDGVSTPIGEINTLRRAVIDDIDELRKNRYDRISNKENIKQFANQYKYKGDYASTDLKLVASVRNLEQLKAAIEVGIETIYYSDIETLEEAIKLYGKDKIIPRLFRITPKDDIYKAKEIIDSVLDQNDQLVVGSYGQLAVFKDYDLIGDYSLNVFNQSTLDEYNEMNIKRNTLSFEMSKNDMKMLTLYENQEFEMIVYGYTPVMVTRYCPLTNAVTHCENCEQKCMEGHILKDKKDAEFPMIKSSNFIEILNSKRLHLLEKAHEIREAGVDVVRLEFTLESYEDVKDIIEIYEDVYSGAVNYYDIKDTGINKIIEDEGFTYGHFFKAID